jgi:hypothetical protein
MKPQILIPVLAATLISSCAERASFQPAENATAIGHGGQPAAAYDVRTDSVNEPTVHVNVWSRGAVESNGATVVRLALDMRNTGQQPVRLDPGQVSLTAYGTDGRPMSQPVGLPAGIDPGSLVVAPGSTRTAQLTFTIPGITPDALASLRLRWGLAIDSGERYVQFTDFGRTQTYASGAYDYDYVPFYGYYDPFFYGPPYIVHDRFHAPIRHVVVRDHRDQHRG